MSGEPDARFADMSSTEPFENGWNRLQTAVEVFVALIVLAGLAGLSGDGPLSPRTVAFAGVPVRMTYQRILRRTAATQIEFRTTAPVARERLEVELPNRLATDMDVVATSPRSEAMRAERDGIVYSFALGPERLGTVTFTIKPRTAGVVDSTVTVDGAAVPLRQLVLP